MDDMVKKGRGRGKSQNGIDNDCAKLNEAAVLLIRADGRKQKYIASDFGVAQGTVSNIKTKKAWAHV